MRTDRKKTRNHGLAMAAPVWRCAALYGRPMQRAVALQLAGSLAATAPMTAFMEQDSAASMLRATLTGSDGQVAADYAEIAALASRLGNQLPGTTAELTAMMNTLASAGVDSKAILGGVGEAAALLKARIGDNLSYVQSAQIMAKLSQATRTVEGDMVALADTIQRSAGMNVRPEEMLAGFSKLSPVLDVLKKEGIEATDALAPLLTAAIGSGMAGESAGNAIRKVLQLSLDSERVGKANEALQGSGMALDFTDGSGEFGGDDLQLVISHGLHRAFVGGKGVVEGDLVNSEPEFLTAIGSRVFFVAYTPRTESTDDYEIWRSDGTKAGTVR